VNDSASYVLVVDDESPFRRMMETVISKEGLRARGASSGEEALQIIGESPPQLVFLDLRLGPEVMGGIETLALIRDRYGDIPVVMVTGYGDVEQAVAAMKLGALDFLEKPLDLDKVRTTLRPVLSRETHRDVGKPMAFGGIIPADDPFQSMLELLTLAASSSAPLLITGESGTGKELAATYAHQNSPRANAPFVKVNCAAIPGNLLESEMFGVEKGAYTGASQSRRGRFEAANCGTLLLDEIGEMDIALQAKLLRVIQEKVVEPIGSMRPRKADVRIIATTNRELSSAIEEGRFREDLFFRLNVFEIAIPPLRDRPRDIIPLAQVFMKELGSERPRRLSTETVSVLKAHRWPGNVRELRNAIERAVILARGGVIHRSHLPATLRREPIATPAPVQRATIHDIEKELIIKTLDANQGNRSKTAKDLGMSRRALYYKLERYDI
jgi:DNA-binding NtrC family response regulator